MYFMLKRVMLYFKFYIRNNIYIFAFRHVYPLVTHSSALWVQADSRQAFGNCEVASKKVPKICRAHLSEDMKHTHLHIGA